MRTLEAAEAVAEMNRAAAELAAAQERAAADALDAPNRVARIRSMFTLTLEVDEWVARCSGRILAHGADRAAVVNEMRLHHSNFIFADEIAAFGEIFPPPARLEYLEEED